MKINYSMVERFKSLLKIANKSLLLKQQVIIYKKRKQQRITEERHFPQYSPLLPGYMCRLLETMLPNKGTYCGVISRYSER